MQGQARLRRRHQGKLQKIPLGGVPERLVNVAQVEAVGLKGAMLLHGQDAEEDGESKDKRQGRE
jgi:hypothetical protein